MKTEKNILAAFILNAAFSIFELIGGLFTGSVSILSDAVHDAGDAVSIGISYLLERESKKKPNEKFTYGYGRYSVVGGFITTVILLVGSFAVICSSVRRFFSPVGINYNGMVVFAVIGVLVNFCGAFITRDGSSVNQKAVNLHLIEDVLGWAVVLIGAVIMKFTDIYLIDPIMSIGVSVFILIGAVKNLKEVTIIFLEGVPHGIDVDEVKRHICKLDGVADVHHVHLWSLDGVNNFATLHVAADGEPALIKKKVKKELREHGIGHVTVEIETEVGDCSEKECKIEPCSVSCHTHHHSH